MVKTKLKPLSLYIHIPFCEKCCSYCDFVSFDNCASRMPAYVDALVNEIQDYAKKCLGHSVKTIFFGGGTPSLLSQNQITKIMSTLFECFEIDKKAEITIESNPSSITKKKCETWLGLGVNRISIGVQSHNPITLKTLGRNHTPKKANQAIQIAAKAGFANINIDIIYNVPVTPDLANSGLRRDLGGEVLHMLLQNPWVTHVSAYSLIIASDTEIAKKLDYEQLYELNEDVCIEEELDLHDTLKTCGFTRYEVSSWARPGFECKHNANYWSANGEYLGLGLGSSGLFDGERYENTDDLNMYLLNPDKVVHREKRTRRDYVNETILLGLRTKQGVSLKRLRELGVNLMVEKAHELLELKHWKLIKITKEAIKPTRDGTFVLNAIIEKLMFERGSADNFSG